MCKRNGTLECINIIRKKYYYEKISKIISDKNNALIVGGGYGATLDDYYNSGLHITFTDIEINAVTFVESKFSKMCVDFNCCSAYDIPYKNNTFDIVVSTLNGSYLNNKALNEFNRVLNNNGILILSETTAEYTDYLYKIGRYDGTYILSSDLKTKIYHPYVYTKKELQKLCCDCGFEPIDYNILRPNNYMLSNQISETIIGFSKNIGVNISDAPLLYYYILKKVE